MTDNLGVRCHNTHQYICTCPSGVRYTCYVNNCAADKHIAIIVIIIIIIIIIILLIVTVEKIRALVIF